MKQYILPAVYIIILLSSCKIASMLYPLSENQNDFLFQKELIGKWGDPKDPSGYCNIDTMAVPGSKLYQIEFINHEKGKSIDTSRFIASLINISGWYFLDCQPDMQKVLSAGQKDYSDLLIARHFLYRLSFIMPDKIEIAYPDTDELIKLIDQKKILLHYSKLKEDDYLILDKPEELQKGLIESKKYPLLYKDKIILVRLK